MSRDFERKAIEFALNRSVEDREAAERMAKFNETVGDWFGNCPKCNTRVQGTLAELRAHSCGPKG